MTHVVQPRRVAIVLMGPPGSGKGTQAELLAKRFGLIHVDTGDYLERILYAPHVAEDPILARERALFEAGKLCSPEWALEQVRRAAERISAAGWSVVFSGSPRTVFEAFGNENHEGLIFALARLYGKQNVHIVRLSVAPLSSLSRNSTRMKCSMCGLPVLGRAKTEMCAFCAGPLMKRSLDDVEVIHVRLKEYEERTAPMFEAISHHGFALQELDGEDLPFKVSEILRTELNLHKGSV